MITSEQIAERGYTPEQINALAAIAEFPAVDVKEAAIAEKCRRKFSTFVKHAWSIVDPATLIWNWHMDAICDHMQAVTEGWIRRLLINVPPGHDKSLLASVLWPAWEWTRDPSMSYLTCSYEEQLATRDAGKSRALIQSKWYQERFAFTPGELDSGWKMTGDQNVKSFYQNTRQGFRLCLTPSGKGTGYRARTILVDDANKALDLYSDTAFPQAIVWWKETMHSRLSNPLHDRKVVIGQRLAEEDLPGHIIKEGGFEHLKLQSRYRAKGQPKSSIGFKDPRTKEGEELFPQLYPKEVLDEAESAKGMGSTGFAGQHQQEPVPIGGTIIKRAWTNNRWHLPSVRPIQLEGTSFIFRNLDPFRVNWDQLILSADCSFKDLETSDRVALGVWGLLHKDKFLLDAKADQMDIVATIAAINDLLNKWKPANRKMGIRAKLIEDKANGPAVISAFHKRVSGFIPIEPQGSKAARLSACAPEWESGSVWLPYDLPFVGEFIDEVTGFPRVRFDDYADMTSQAINYLSIDPEGDTFKKLTSK